MLHYSFLLALAVAVVVVALPHRDSDSVSVILTLRDNVTHATVMDRLAPCIPSSALPPAQISLGSWLALAVTLPTVLYPPCLTAFAHSVQESDIHLDDSGMTRWSNLLSDLISDIDIDLPVNAWTTTIASPTVIPLELLVNAVSPPSTPICTESPAANWGIDRLARPNLPLLGVYKFACPANPINATIYVVDTGINLQHREFQGRVQWGDTFVENAPNTDDNGHGTFVAGLAAGSSYGVAKNASLVAVKSLDSKGDGTISQVIRGLQWSVQNKPNNSIAIVNLSLGGTFSRSLNRAVTEATNSGVLVTVAAGNDATDACLFSPASSSRAITVGSTNFKDQLSTFSNRGRCVDIMAPGEAIQSAWIGSSSASRNASGTSFASPMVAGVIAQYAAVGILNSSSSVVSVKRELIRLGAKDKINVSAGGSSFMELISPTPNILAQVSM